MAEERIETGNPEHVTIIKESPPARGSGGILVAVIALVVIAVVAFWAIDGSRQVDPSDASISAAADKVGNAAQKVGKAAEDAVKKID